MSVSVLKPCRLCGLAKPLRSSHVFPKFCSDWLKRTGGKHFRFPNNPNKRMQDGYKCRLLCDDCERLFSAFESEMALRVFRPIVDRLSGSVRYGAWFYRFLVSVLWRNLAIDLDDANAEPDFSPVEEAWRLFLLNGQALSEYGRIHVFVSDIPSSGPPGLSVYLVRDTDFTVVRGRQAENSPLEPIAVYAKFSRFIIWAEVSKQVDSSRWVNTLVTNGSGILAPSTQVISDELFGSFLVERSEMVRQIKSQMQMEISVTQQTKIVQSIEDDFDRFEKSDMMRAMSADFEQIRQFSERRRVGRNDRCPCGSNKKYKRCHGASF